MKHTRNRRLRSNRPMKRARNYWFWYTGQLRAYDAMMADIARRLNLRGYIGP